MRLTLDHGGRPTDLDLGDTSEQTGVEYGQLFSYTIDGNPRIELGQFTPATQQWEPVNPLTVSVPDLIAADEAEQEGN
ncbi:hypothetical protein [Gulosibacter molinativorax]|uniref:Uncharacterized protein n=1 Tax=Gulosibacter molinativorax TaxID=256821 RepID=A0ABT7C538_9MICO|nr:hypothetical protein [Gulosibacter molinativorax]MDJ1370269.1 hypothetical protein [Gulosibacter molinativorax]QUY61685.1 Hypotetical protein [Gulosibacter molinativorax]